MAREKRATMTAAEVKAYRQSRKVVMVKFRQAHHLLKKNDPAALYRFDEALAKSKQLRAIARTYLRRISKR